MICGVKECWRIAQKRLAFAFLRVSCATHFLEKQKPIYFYGNSKRPPPRHGDQLQWRHLRGAGFPAPHAGNLRAFVQASLRSIRTGKSSDIRLSSTEKIEPVPMITTKMEFSYKDGQDYVFTDRPATKP